MKQAGYSKRQNSRSPDRHRQQPHRQANGNSSDQKMRGNAQQCVDKYLTLARDAATSGDPISAENYYQYADHYFRIVLANRPSRLPPIRKPMDIETAAPVASENPVQVLPPQSSLESLPMSDHALNTSN
ncbi:MAG: DUF4167 domain-containing protein [Alphaproteobacteria bacterium]|nr:DUF4167 domain-containing protein [Alphaproteobacteria bacterium]